MLARRSLLNLQVSNKSLIILHVQKADDLLLKSAILSSAKRLVDPTVEEFLIEEAEVLDAKNYITLLVKSAERQPPLGARIAALFITILTTGGEKPKCR